MFVQESTDSIWLVGTITILLSVKFSVEQMQSFRILNLEEWREWNLIFGI